MATQSAETTAPAQEAFEPLQSDIISIEEAAPEVGHDVVVGADGAEHVTGVFPPFDFTTFPSQLFWLAISFGLLYLLLSRMALPRIGTILDDRKARIEGDLAAADASRQQTEAAITAYETALAEARRKSHALAEETRETIRRDIDVRRKAVEAELGEKTAAAEARIAATKTEALRHVDEIAVDTVEAIVAQLTGSTDRQDAAAAVARAAKE